MPDTPTTAPDGTITFANAGDLSRWLKHWQEKSWSAGRCQAAEEIIAECQREREAKGRDPFVSTGLMYAQAIAREVGDLP